jgi:mono/diheme cytochrome c family protein
LGVNLSRYALSWLVLAGCCQGALAKMTPEQVQRLPAPATRSVDFATDIQPILRQSCVNCHGKGRAKGGFQIDTRETLLREGDSGLAVVPGRSEASLLIELVAAVDPENFMPKKGRRLTPAQVSLLRAWIDQGLPWDDSVSFAKTAPLNMTPGAPEVSHLEGENPIDVLLKPYYANKGVKPGPVAEDRTFARRVYLDIIGLLPPPDELKAFLGDNDPDKREKLVRRLLGDRKNFAEHWLTFWNDLLRNDYRGTGYIDGGRKQITPWLYAALSNNIPYHQFVSELINPPPQSEGFVKGIVWRGVVNASQTPEMQAAQNISQVFMGVNLKCASCHDSFINDWRLSDAYGLAAIYSDGPLEMFRCDKPTGTKAAASFIYPELGEINPEADKPARLKRLAELITSEKDGRLSRTMVNRLWARFFGHGLVEPVDDMEQPAWDQGLLDWLAQDLVSSGYDVKKTIERIVTSKAYQLPAVDLGESGSKGFVFKGPGVRRLSAEQFRDALAQLTGVWFGHAEVGGGTNEVRASLVSADPLTTALGRPNREQVVTTRATTATTLQGLELTNGDTLAVVLQRGATLLTAPSPAPTALVEQLFQRALSRPPTSKEKELAVAELSETPGTEGVQDLLWTLSMLPEFQLIY